MEVFSEVDVVVFTWRSITSAPPPTTRRPLGASKRTLKFEPILNLLTPDSDFIYEQLNDVVGKRRRIELNIGLRSIWTITNDTPQPDSRPRDVVQNKP